VVLWQDRGQPDLAYDICQKYFQEDRDWVRVDEADIQELFETSYICDLQDEDLEVFIRIMEANLQPIHDHRLKI
jgi:hypothetical protein